MSTKYRKKSRNWTSIAGSAGLMAVVALVACAGASAQPADRGKSVIVVLDASGSMRAKLSGGEERIAAAKAAVTDFVGKLDPSIRLALRAYGHQSPTSAKNCKDTSLVVGFGAASSNSREVVAALPGIRAQGYTPITEVLGTAADDIGKEPSAQRVIVLVSDGKETCPGDPCATARKLAQADSRLVIHSIGFAVDAAARLQLQCIARAGGGRYVEAGSAGELARGLSLVTDAPRSFKSEQRMALDKPGRLKVAGADRHKVLDAETGMEVTEISNIADSKSLKAGLYHVTFANGVWKSVEVRPGETTELRPGTLRVRAAGSRKVQVRDPETGEVFADISALKGHAVLIPTRYQLMFGDTPSKEIVLDPGARLVFNNATVTLKNSAPGTYELRDEEGRLTASLSALHASAAVPPGRYTLTFKGKSLPLEVGEGEDREVRWE